jgi:hypothetical protein
MKTRSTGMRNESIGIKTRSTGMRNESIGMKTRSTGMKTRRLAIGKKDGDFLAHVSAWFSTV